MSYRILQHIMIFIKLDQAMGGCKYEITNYLRSEAAGWKKEVRHT